MENLNTYKPNTLIDLLNELDELKFQNIEQLYFMFKIYIETYFHCRNSFGNDDELTKCCTNEFKKYYKIIKQENSLFKYMINNLNRFDLDATARVIDTLEEVNENTVLYYVDVFDKLLTCAEMNDPSRFYFPRKRFEDLNDTDYYKKMVVGLSFNDDYIRNYLNYPKDFWKFIDGIKKSVNTTPEIVSHMSYAVPIYDSNNCVCNMDLLVPEVIDIETAIIALNTYNKAYRIYCSFGKQFNNEVIKTNDSEFIDSIDYVKLSKKRIA